MDVLLEFNSSVEKYPRERLGVGDEGRRRKGGRKEGRWVGT